jgi:hypothetical protein
MKVKSNIETFMGKMAVTDYYVSSWYYGGYFLKSLWLLLWSVPSLFFIRKPKDCLL